MTSRSREREHVARAPMVVLVGGSGRPVAGSLTRSGNTPRSALAPRIDGLLVVAHREYLVVIAREGADHGVLDAVEILELVHQHVGSSARGSCPRRPALSETARSTLSTRSSKSTTLRLAGNRSVSLCTGLRPDGPGARPGTDATRSGPGASAATARAPAVSEARTAGTARPRCRSPSERRINPAELAAATRRRRRGWCRA